jgi:hypothetical protein
MGPEFADPHAGLAPLAKGKRTSHQLVLATVKHVRVPRRFDLLANRFGNRLPIQLLQQRLVIERVDGRRTSHQEQEDHRSRAWLAGEENVGLEGAKRINNRLASEGRSRTPLLKGGQCHGPKTHPVAKEKVPARNTRYDEHAASP